MNKELLQTKTDPKRMAKIVLNDMIKSASGKASGDSNFYYYTNRVTGQASTRKIGNDPNKKPSPAQLAQRKAFQEKTQILKRWFEDNKPSEALPAGSEQYQTWRAEMVGKGKTNDFYHFVWRKLFPKPQK